jgi:hypothetical protein
MAAELSGSPNRWQSATLVEEWSRDVKGFLQIAHPSVGVSHAPACLMGGAFLHESITIPTLNPQTQSRFGTRSLRPGGR